MRTLELDGVSDASVREVRNTLGDEQVTLLSNGVAASSVPSNESSDAGNT